MHSLSMYHTYHQCMGPSAVMKILDHSWWLSSLCKPVLNTFFKLLQNLLPSYLGGKNSACKIYFYDNLLDKLIKKSCVNIQNKSLPKVFHASQHNSSLIFSSLISFSRFLAGFFFFLPEGTIVFPLLYITLLCFSELQWCSK